MHLSHPSFPRTSSLWLCPCVKLHTWRSPSPSHPWTPRSPCMYGIALPTLLLDTLCGRFSMTGKVEAIRGTPQIEMTYFSFSFIHLNWMGLSWWVLNLLAAQSTKNDTFDESFQKSHEKYEFLILGVNCPLFKLQYMHSLLSSWQCFFFTPWTDVPTLWTTWEALSLWTTRARPPPTPKSGGLMSRPLPSWTLTQAVQV